jgi:hypothetical protein
MKDKVFLGIQVLVGLMLIVFGLNKFLHFIPMPPPTEEMGAYMGALIQTGFLFPLIALIEIIVGFSLVINKFAALMVLIVMPVMINAILAHLFLDPAGIGASAFIVSALIIVIIRHKERYSSLFKA